MSPSSTKKTQLEYLRYHITHFNTLGILFPKNGILLATKNIIIPKANNDHNP